MMVRPFALGSCLFVAGCCGMCSATTKSENVRTEGMRADVTVESRGDGKTYVDMHLRVGTAFSNVFPELSSGDRLEVTDGAATVPLLFDRGIVSQHAYRATLPGDASGRTIEVRFHRTGNTSALGTRVAIPPALTITSPAPRTRFSPARNVLALTWAPPASAPLSWKVEGPCIVDVHGEVAVDTGKMEILLAAAPPPDGGARVGACDVTARIERVVHGVLDPAFGEGGSIDAKQSREIKFEFTP